MYSLKPYYDSNAPVKLPDCMYKLGTANLTTCDSTSNTQSKCTSVEHKPLNEVWDSTVAKNLENRQDEILKRLQELKSKVDKLVTSADSKEKQVGTVSSDNDGLIDIVISAHPAAPPYALLVLQQMLAKQRKVLTACHRHSSVCDAAANLLSILGDSTQTVTTDRNEFDVVFTLIWKDVKHGPHMMVNPRTQTSIHGEGNIARYLARLITPSYDSGDVTTATMIDQWVESAERFSHGNNKEKASVYKSMNTHLGKSEWMVGESASLADVMLWGAVTQAKESGKAPANVKKWYQRCCDMEVFRFVVDML